MVRSLADGDVRPVATESGPLAFYTGPSPDGARGGTFFYNAGDPMAWRRPLVEVSAFHEAIPGITSRWPWPWRPVSTRSSVSWRSPVTARAGAVRRAAGRRDGPLPLAPATARHGDDGFAAGGPARGRHRAPRPGLDTPEALDVAIRHTAQAPNAAIEVDRYIADPGQATSYMIGRLEIQQLRREATERLGPAFSLPAFHGVVLGHGSLPLVELRRTVDRWVTGAMRERGAPI